MSTTYSATGWDRRFASARRVVHFLEKHWDALLERRKRARLCSALSDLDDRELMDIGLSRGEIDFVVANRIIDPRGTRSIPPINI
jgi:uncharacterized protein YjiS (DUF1127 family)